MQFIQQVGWHACMRKNYKVVSILIEIDTAIELTKIWEQFADSTIGEEALIVCFGKLQKLFGLEALKISYPNCMLLRNENDLIIVDANWSTGMLMQTVREE